MEREVTEEQDGQFKNRAKQRTLKIGQKHRPHGSRAMMPLDGGNSRTGCIDYMYEFSLYLWRKVENSICIFSALEQFFTFLFQNKYPSSEMLSWMNTGMRSI